MHFKGFDLQRLRGRLLDNVARKGHSDRIAVTQPSVRVIKEFSFRGATQQFSNRYYFTGGTPSSDANWHTFFDQVKDYEKLCINAAVSIIEIHGYVAPSDVAVASKAYTQAGSLSSGTDVPGECAALLRHGTSKLSSRNHPVYVFSYFHKCHRDSSDADTLDATTKTALETYGGHWLSGITAGGITAVRSTPDGVAVNGTHVATFLTHRDFPH